MTSFEKRTRDVVEKHLTKVKLYLTLDIMYGEINSKFVKKLIHTRDILDYADFLNKTSPLDRCLCGIKSDG